MPKPEPIITAQVCSLCGLDWSRHSNRPTMAECIDLLKAELAMRQFTTPITPWQPSWPSFWYSTTVADSAFSASSTSLSLVVDDEEPPDAVAV